MRKHNRENPGIPINKGNFAEKLKDAYNDFYRPNIVVNSFASSGIYPVNKAVISDDQLKTGLTFNPDDEQTENDSKQKEAESSHHVESQSINEKVFNTYVSELKTPVKKKYMKRQEEGYNVHGVSPGYDTYVLLKSKVNSEQATVEQSISQEHSINITGPEQFTVSARQDIEDANQIP